MQDLDHISIIMDGNRRYAKKYHLTEKESYIKGGEKALEIAKYIAMHYPTKHLSLYTFSYDNNKKRNHISFEDALYEANTALDEIVNSFKLHFIGDINGLPERFIKKIKELQKKNAEIKQFPYLLEIYLMVNYSGSYDLECTFNAIISNSNALQPKKFYEIMKYSLVANLPQINLLIRVGGRRRLSDYIMFLLLYSEIYFHDKLWNEFTVEDFKEITDHYERNRICTFGE
jgi:undecaprenyl diphosphate synthase